MAAMGETPSCEPFERFDEVDFDIVERLLKPDLQELQSDGLAVVQGTVKEMGTGNDAMALPESPIEAPSEHQDCLHPWQALSRESTEPPTSNENEDFEEDDFEDACDVDEPGFWSAGRINVSLVQKSIKPVPGEGDSDCYIAKEPRIGHWNWECANGLGNGNWECAREVLNQSDHNDHILVRQIIREDRSHWKYFEDASWRNFDPEFAQQIVQCPLRPILEEVQESCRPLIAAI